jgi:hypothetical protein
MRRVILVTALVLLSALAQAGPSRGLVLVSNDEPVVAEQSKTADAPKAVEAPKTEAKTKTDAKSEVPNLSSGPRRLVRPPKNRSPSVNQPKRA